LSSLVALLLILSLAIGWSETGLTAGKQVMGLRLVESSWGRPSSTPSFIRSGGCHGVELAL
jgi:hypothetical protein